MDPKTRLMLYKLVSGEVLEAVNGCISTGKEACVFHANGGRFVKLIYQYHLPQRGIVLAVLLCKNLFIHST